MIGVRPGDNDQVIALAEALGLPFELKPIEYNAFCHLGPRLLGHSTVSLTQSSRAALFDEEPPDLTISAGHRSVPIVRALRRRSGALRSIHAGFPRVSPGNFDLVVATPQYPIADHPNLLRVPYALTRAATSAPDSTGEALLASLPSPRHLLIVGGPTLFWKIDETLLLRTLARILEEAGKHGGSVLVTTSPRTPPQLARNIVRMIDDSAVPSIFAAPGKAPAYSSLLRAADSIRATADSVSMVSDAIWTGKPMALVPIASSAAGRILFAIMDRLRPGQRVYPQDLRFFWRALASIGISEELKVPRASSDEEMRRVHDRIDALLPRAEPTLSRR